MVRTFKIGNFTVGAGKLLFMGGPCMAESLEICLETADFLTQLTATRNVNYVFKASFDKANRSSGASYRGPGLEKGLAMLQEVKKRYNVPVVTDVHETSQVKDVAEVADILQIPAFLCRQTDLLEACAATGRAVNIKKGQFMAPEDMRGALEKVYSVNQAAGAMLTERGTTFGYHNLVVDMRSFQTMRSLGAPVVFDATHSVQLPGGLGNASGGQREFIRTLARSAAASGIDGLFAEVHPNPAKALSDGANSLDFASAEKVLDEVLKIHEITKTYID